MKKKIGYQELSFPKGLNLAILEKVLTSEELMDFLVKHSKDERLNRRIILPSERTLKKVFAHYFMCQIKKGKISWEEIKNDFKKEFKSLKAIDFSKFECMRLWEQREKEILEEKIKELIT